MSILAAAAAPDGTVHSGVAIAAVPQCSLPARRAHSALTRCCSSLRLDIWPFVRRGDQSPCATAIELRRTQSGSLPARRCLAEDSTTRHRPCAAAFVIRSAASPGEWRVPWELAGRTSSGSCRCAARHHGCGALRCRLWWVRSEMPEAHAGRTQPIVYAARGAQARALCRRPDKLRADASIAPRAMRYTGPLETR
eukprot:scaffold7500_cov127-Isochrysis_galbana.AAC.3